MNKRERAIKYFLYARKSSESEDRQVQSIEDQVNALKELAATKSLNVVKIFEESKSAKTPWERPVFYEMLKRIKRREAQGILCWHINRLSRNPIDSGKINWMLQQGEIQSLQTIEGEHLPDDNVLLFSVVSAMSNQFSRDLSKNVKRGIKGKLERGELPGVPPQGYINDLATHTIVQDPERFHLVKQAWDLLLSGNYSVAQIRDKMNNQWGYRTIRHKKRGGIPIGVSTLYNAFCNKFYAGVLVSSGKEYIGKHEQMITLAQYDRAQELLGRVVRPHYRKHAAPFTHLIKCGACGHAIIADVKTKYVKSVNGMASYTYYHCGQKCRGCLNQTSINKNELCEIIADKLGRYEIPDELATRGITYVRSQLLTTAQDNALVEEATQVLETKKANLRQQIANLTRMCARELIPDYEYSAERQRLDNELATLNLRAEQEPNKKTSVLLAMEKALAFGLELKKRFLNGSLEKQNEILSQFARTCTLEGKTLIIQGCLELESIATSVARVLHEMTLLEPDKTNTSAEQSAVFKPINTFWDNKKDRLQVVSLFWHAELDMIINQLTEHHEDEGILD